MAFEKYDNKNGCNPMLPLNSITNNVYLYGVNVFEKEFEIAKVVAEGKISNPFLPINGKLKVRLGLPLSELYPDFGNVYKSLYLSNKKKDFTPTIIGVEKVYATIADDIKEPQIGKIIDIEVNDQDFKKGEVKIDGKAISISKYINQLDSPDNLIICHEDQLYQLKKTNFKKPAKSLFFSTAAGVLTKLMDLDALDDQLYFDTLAALLFDPRSNQTSFGKKADKFDPSFLNDREFNLFLAHYKTDDRYQIYLNNFNKDEQKTDGNLPVYEIGMVTAYLQEWTLQGYSKGSLINSITLAPQEELTIEIFTYDKFKIEEESTTTTEFESSKESSSLSKISSQIALDLSETTNTSGGLGIGVTLPIQAIPVNINANASASNELKESINNTLQNINETTLKATERFKAVTQVKIAQTHEFGQENRTTRKIKNQNASRTLTLNYFEVVENHQVITKVKSYNNYCLLVENPAYGPINLDFLLAYENRLQKILLHTTYQEGFIAAKKLVAQRWFEKKSALKTEIDNINSQNGGTNTARNLAPEKPIIRVAKGLKAKFDEFSNLNIEQSIKVLGAHYDPFKPKAEKPSKRQVNDAEEALGKLNFWIKYKFASSGIEGRALAFSAAISRQATEAECATALENLLIGLDDEWLTTVKMVAINLVILQLTALALIPAPWLVPVLPTIALINNDLGLPALIEKAKKELKTYEVANLVPTSIQSPSAANAPVATTQAPPPQVFSIAELAMANASYEKLVLHIEANKTYYFNHLWLYEDAGERYEMLKAKGVINFIDNKILCFVGNKTAYPLNMATINESLRKDLLQNYSNVVAPKEVKIENVALPTSGMYVDSVVGTCESLEPYLIERRAIEKEMSQLQNDIAKEKLVQMRIESQRLQNLPKP